MSCISVTKYEKVEHVGRGSFGDAWKIKYVNTGKEYILKTLHIRGRTQEDMKRGENEVKALKKCDDKNTVGADRNETLVFVNFSA